LHGHPFVTRGTELLLVDDDDDLRAGMRETLERAGHHVIGFADAGTALAYLDTRPVPLSLVVLDWMLPGMTATEFLDALARRPPHDTTPVLVLTGYDRVSAGDGIAAVIQKPVRARTLTGVVDRLLLLPRTPLPIVDRVSGRIREAQPAEPVRKPARTVALRPPR
jgi:DNA-binding response OmpR family regulator